MQVQVNTGNGLENNETLDRWTDRFLNETLVRFSLDVKRIEVQLSDENGVKGGAADKRCTLEARLPGLPPVAATHHGANQDEAIRGATHRLAHALDHALGKLDRHAHRQRDTIRRDPDLIAE